MARVAIARGYASGRLYEPGEPVPDGVPDGKWIAEVDGRSKKLPEAIDDSPGDNLDSRTAKALRDIAKAEGVKGIETDDNKADLIRKIRAHREAGAAKE